MRTFLTYIFDCFISSNNGSINIDISLSVYLNGSLAFLLRILCCVPLFSKFIILLDYIVIVEIDCNGKIATRNLMFF